MKALQVLALFCLAVFGANAAHYAVLVAGSNYFYNYRHQSDIFHAYQSLVGYGYKPENIITFAYDDIAHDSQNPFKGQVFNKPTAKGTPGKDVYAGVKIDYKGAEVTPQNFLDVLKGSDTLRKQGKKVLESTSADNVFIYFSDHGASSLIAFPSQYLYANDLIATLKAMNDAGKYKQLVFYIEACESGSMFEGILPQNINIYTTTASNAIESSWATYCSPDDKVDGKSVGSCLGDLYSVKFLENLDSVDPSVETLITQFGIIVQQTTQSHVQRYGDVSISNQVIGEFQADRSSTKPLVENAEKSKKSSGVDSRYNKLFYLQNRHQLQGTHETLSALMEEEASIQRYDNLFASFVQTFNLNLDAEVSNVGLDFDCFKQRMALYEEMCGKFSDYGLQYVKAIKYTCAQGVSLNAFETALLNHCM